MSSWSITSSNTGIDTLILQTYFNFDVSDGTFSMYTTDSFESFSEKAYSNEEPSVSVQFELLFNCDSTAAVVSIVLKN